MCNSCSVVLTAIISSPSGNGSKGVVGIPLRLLLQFDGGSVASSQQNTSGFTKKVHEPIIAWR
jgi:hypothetical protein